MKLYVFFSSSEEFVETIKANFGHENNFTIREVQQGKGTAIVANFYKDNFEIELLGQNTPTKQQPDYRHLIIEHKLLEQYAEQFRQQIIELKQKGYKTEAAFVLALGITGNAYTELLKFEKSINNL